MNVNVKVNPVQVFPHVATELRIVGVQVRQLGEGGQAIVAWQLCTEEGSPVQSGAVEVSGEEYTAWGDDDSYIVNLSVSKLGLESIS